MNRDSAKGDHDQKGKRWHHQPPVTARGVECGSGLPQLSLAEARAGHRSHRRPLPELLRNFPPEPNPRAWLILLAGVLVAYVALTHGIWLNLTKNLTEVNDRITQAVEDFG